MSSNNLSAHIAKHFRDVHFGGNWTSVNLKDTLAGVTWQQATAKVHDFNTIAVLVFHINYYVGGLIKVLQGGPLDIRDKYSFDCPPIESAEDWERLLGKTWAEAEQYIQLVEQLPDSILMEIFVDEKYGTYYRNLHGIVEHTHYHLGQIVLIKKSSRKRCKHTKCQRRASCAPLAFFFVANRPFDL
jgi:uncharacterized damage-inducible protein DinB